MQDMITVLGISGSMRWPSHTHTIMELALSAARESGARVELLDLRTVPLPLYDPGQREVPAIVTEMRERVAEAHAYLIGTPEYHGSMSGALKNFFDFLYPEVNGKLFGLLVATGNDVGANALSHLRTVISFLHGWSLPYNAGASVIDFDEAGHLVNERARDRILRLGRDVTVYGESLYARYTRDCIYGGGPQLGYAPWHARE